MMSKDPLKLLREYALDGKNIKERENYIIFGDMAFEKNVKTNFKVYGKTNEYYDLESLYFFYQKREMVHTAYVKEVASKKIQPITRADRKDLIQYLTKPDAKAPSSIDVTAPIAVPVHFGRAPQSSQAADHQSAPDSKRPRIDEAAQMKKERERLERLLDAPLRPPASNDASIRPLSEALTADKIKELKTKMITRKRVQISATVEDDLSAADATAGVGFSRMDSDALDRDLKARERTWRTRTSCLEAGNKNFAKSIFPILHSLKNKEDGSKNSSQHPSDPQIKSEPQTGKKSSQQASTGYNRYGQEEFRREETAGFQIDTVGTFHGITLKSITEGAKPKQAAPNNPNSNSSSIPTGSSAANSSSADNPKKRVSRTPIIIIPATNNSLITMYNAKDILQDCKFVGTDDKKSMGFRRENECLIQRQKNGVSIPYRVIDNPLKLGPEEWDRVVAVFVQGPAWQFKGWPWGGNPVQIFAKIAAFHLKWEEMKLDTNVGKWNVKVVSMSKNRRHLDRAHLLKLWEDLDRYMVKHKPHLRY